VSAGTPTNLRFFLWFCRALKTDSCIALDKIPRTQLPTYFSFHYTEFVQIPFPVSKFYYVIKRYRPKYVGFCKYCFLTKNIFIYALVYLNIESFSDPDYIKPIVQCCPYAGTGTGGGG
jgi:hypothetical protein